MNSECNNYGKTGHWATVCRSSKKTANETPNKSPPLAQLWTMQRLVFRGSKPPSTVCYVARKEPPQLFEYLSRNIEPIITESRIHSNDDYKFIKK
ncbi:hypothetical protein JTB14_036804 [Gonioctena quinquepunctata]|nr:hypothetical protein JTB14_036804 [Gonioctena quinquepunctata]